MEQLPIILIIMTRTFSDSPNNMKFGRGNDKRKIRGNMLYRDLIGSYRDRYMYARSNREKHQLAMAMIGEFREHGGTFFIENVNGFWVEASYEVTLQKVKQAIRERGAIEQRRLENQEVGATLSPPSLQEGEQDTRIYWNVPGNSLFDSRLVMHGHDVSTTVFEGV